MSFFSLPGPTDMLLESKQVQDPSTFRNFPCVVPSLVHAEQGCPEQVKQWLFSLGWTSATFHPDTQEPLFQKSVMKVVKETTIDLTDCQYYRWYEAVAFEFFFFMSVGGNP